MSQQDEPPPNPPAELELAHRQAIKYGQDLARIYMAEKTKREQLEVAYQALTAVFASTPDGLVVLNNAYRIQQANAAFGRLVEMELKATVGKSINEVLNSPELRTALENLAADDSAPGEVELTVTTPVKRSLLANIAKLQAGRLHGWIVVLHDQTRRKRLEHQKNEFINIASHELRTPLGAVIGYGELLKDSLSGKPVGDESHEYLDALARGAFRLKNIIDELIQFAEINQGEVPAQSLTAFYLPNLIDDVILDLQQLANEKRVDLRNETQGQTIQVSVDHNLLRAAIYQLVLNAINFNKPDGYVSVKGENGRGPAGGQITVCVVDTGIGIAQTDLEIIDRAFFQVEHPDTRRVGGLGLGLTIVQRALSLLGGTLTIESTLGSGTTVSFTIPIK
jgi:signal transduction histidine kinase